MRDDEKEDIYTALSCILLIIVNITNKNINISITSRIELRE